MGHKQLHIFDLDDTLISTRLAYLTSYQDMAMKHFNIDFDLADTIIKYLLTVYSSSSYQDIFKSIMLLTRNLNKIELISKICEEFLLCYWQRLKLYPSALSYLQKIKSEHKILALASNGSGPIQRSKLKYLQLEVFFDVENILISSEFNNQLAKPSPAMLKHILEFNQIDSAQAVYYGNCLSDFLSAKSANIDFVLHKLDAEKIFDNKDIDLNLLAKFDHWDQLLKLI